MSIYSLILKIIVVWRVMQSGVLPLLVFFLTRDLSNSKRFTLLDNKIFNSSGLAVGGSSLLSSVLSNL